MDNYPYCRVGADSWLHTDGLHHEGFTTLMWAFLCHFGCKTWPTYRGGVYHEFGMGWCEVHIVHVGQGQRHGRHAGESCTLGDTDGTSIAMFPIRDQGNPSWQERRLRCHAFDLPCGLGGVTTLHLARLWPASEGRSGQYLLAHTHLVWPEGGWQGPPDSRVPRHIQYHQKHAIDLNDEVMKTYS
jgi:hypothetical protein